MADLPIKFEEKVKAAPSAGGTGYPYRISATDLDKNFAYAALDAEDDWIEQSSVGEYNGRKLKLPVLPSGGTFALSCVNGTVQWIKTGISVPFEIIVESGSTPRYKISSNSSIINGINGDPFAINTLDSFKGISETKFIVAEATVTSDPFEITDDGFTIKEVVESDTDEVVIDNGKQTKIRLLIGKILAKPIEGGGIQLEAHQAVATSFRSAVNFHNGIPVYVLQVAPIHQSVFPNSID